MIKHGSENTQFVLDEMERTRWKRTFSTLAKDWRLYVLLIPLLIFLVLFRYMPIYGILEAFKIGVRGQAVMEMEWRGLLQFHQLFANATFWRALRNTFVGSMYGLIFGFPIPIIIALLFSEIKNDISRSVLQVAVYLPNFISTVVITSIIILWTSISMPSRNISAGMITTLFVRLGLIENDTVSIMQQARFFRGIFQVTGIWEGAGFGSIVYFAAVMSISPTNYEAAKIDGASKWQQIRYVTFPGMAPTLTIMLIMRIGAILNVGYERVLLLYNNHTFETADVISTFVFREATELGGIPQLAVAADMFNSLIAMFLVLGANAISRRVSTTSLF